MNIIIESLKTNICKFQANENPSIITKHDKNSKAPARVSLKKDFYSTLMRSSRYLLHAAVINCQF